MRSIEYFGFLFFCGTFFSPSNGQLHFATIGNWGASTAAQKKSISTLQNEDSKLSFIVSTGPNFPKGLENGTDSTWGEKFTSVFSGASTNVPMFTVIGEGDWSNGNWTALVAKSDDAYAPEKRSAVEEARWTFPNWWYHYSTHFRDASGGALSGGVDGSIAFVFVDTRILASDFPYENITKMAWNDARQTAESAWKIYDWVVVVGDRSLYSSGATKGNKALARTLGGLMKDNYVDMYISGGDNDLEIIMNDGLLHVNCGSFSIGDKWPRSRLTESLFYTGATGYCRHSVTKEKLTTEIVDGLTGKILHSTFIERRQKDRNILHRFNVYRGLPPVKFVDVPYKPGRVPVRPGDLFVIIVGTLGLLTAGYVALMWLATFANRASK